jgi:hypothetical protein
MEPLPINEMAQSRLRWISARNASLQSSRMAWLLIVAHKMYTAPVMAHRASHLVHQLFKTPEAIICGNGSSLLDFYTKDINQQRDENGSDRSA